MLSFVVLEKDEGLRGTYVKLIKNFLYGTNEHYNISEFSTYTVDVDKKIEHKKGTCIYIIDVDDETVDMFKVARRIRNRGDLKSQIILVSKGDKEKYIDKLYNVLFLDFIKIDKRLIFRLMRSIKEAYRIITRYEAYAFTAFDEVYGIVYDDIYFVTKNLNEDSVTIFTKDKKYLNYVSLKGIEAELAGDPRFLKVHRSCIINLYHISSYDKKSNTIFFNNGMQTNLVSRHYKAELAKRIKDFIDKL